MAGSTFSIDVAKFVAKAKGNADLVLRKIALEMLRRVVLKSPVGNPDLWVRKPPPGYVGGRFRGNWQAAINQQPQGTFKTIDKSGSASIARAAPVVLRAKIGDTIYVVNNLPYARPLEYGWSSQAPAGMVRVTVKEFSALVSAEAKKTKGS